MGDLNLPIAQDGVELALAKAGLAPALGGREGPAREALWSLCSRFGEI